MIKNVIIIICIMFLISSCTDPIKTLKVLEDNGYDVIKIGGWNYFAMGQGDKTATGFVAKDCNGEIVRGYVTDGWINGVMIKIKK